MVFLPHMGSSFMLVKSSDWIGSVWLWCLTRSESILITLSFEIEISILGLSGHSIKYR